MRYDTEYVSELASEGKAADNDGDGSPMHYLLKYDDGDDEHISWRAIQVGIRNTTSGGFIDVAHQHPLPSGQINTDNGKLWSLRDASPQDLLGISVPIFPEIEDNIEDTDGCGSQFQEQTNSDRVTRSTSSVIGVRR